MLKEKQNKNLWFVKSSNQFILYAAHFAVLHAKHWEKFTVDLHVLKGVSTVFQKYRINFENLCARRMDQSNKHYEDP